MPFKENVYGQCYIRGFYLVGSLIRRAEPFVQLR